LMCVHNQTWWDVCQKKDGGVVERGRERWESVTSHRKHVCSYEFFFLHHSRNSGGGLGGGIPPTLPLATRRFPRNDTIRKAFLERLNDWLHWFHCTEH
jgi:hypothetical protein